MELHLYFFLVPFRRESTKVRSESPEFLYLWLFSLDGQGEPIQSSCEIKVGLTSSSETQLFTPKGEDNLV